MIRIDLKKFTKDERLEIKKNLRASKWDARLGKKPLSAKEEWSVQSTVICENSRDYGHVPKAPLPYIEGNDFDLRFHVLSGGSEYVIDEITIKTVLLTGIDKNAPQEIVEAFKQAAELWRREQRHHSRKVRIENSNVKSETTSITQE